METLPIEVWNVEPMKGALSTRMTFAPFCAAERAHASPARPEPMTTMSAERPSPASPVAAPSSLFWGAQPPNASVPPSTAAPMTTCLLLNDAMM